MTEFSITDFFSECDEIRGFRYIQWKNPSWEILFFVQCNITAMGQICLTEKALLFSKTFDLDFIHRCFGLYLRNICQNKISRCTMMRVFITHWSFYLMFKGDGKCVCCVCVCVGVCVCHGGNGGGGNGCFNLTLCMAVNSFTWMGDPSLRLYCSESRFSYILLKVSRETYLLVSKDYCEYITNVKNYASALDFMWNICEGLYNKLTVF